VIDLDARLARGPLRVRNLWSGEGPERIARRMLHRRRFTVALDLAVAAACAVLVFLGSRRTMTAAPQLATAAAPAATAPAAPTATFHDGSVAELLGRDADLRVEQETPQHVVARLKGGARFRVVHNRQRTFEVQAGEVRVRVLGTTFSVVQLPSGPTQVLVEQGHVQVAWLGGATELQAGEGGVFPPPDGGLVEAPAPAALPDDTQPSSGTGGPAAAAGSHATIGTRKTWRDYAVRGEYGQAYDELSATGHDVRDEAADLMLAADVARLSGHPEQAIAPLRRLCDRHPGDRRAPVAAFTLGRVLLDDLGRANEAAAAFEKARVLWPRGPLAEDALAREADAWARAGHTDRARAIAEQYLARYPAGRHADVLRSIASR
jgi:transmembrane sensor